MALAPVNPEQQMRLPDNESHLDCEKMEEGLHKFTWSPQVGNRT